MKGLHINTIIFIGLTLISTGQFYKIFGQSQTNFQTTVSQTKTVDHMPEWDFYFSNVDGKLSSLHVDLGLYKFAPIEDKSNFAWITIKMNSAREDGLSSSGESELLEKFEDKLVAKLNSKFNSIYVGKLTSNGHRDFYFYVGDTTFYNKVLSDFIKAYPEYHFDYGSKSDGKWSGYFDFLYPHHRSFKAFKTGVLLTNLKRMGIN